MVTADEVRRFSLTLPEAEERDHWGKPSFRVRDKIFAALQEDGVSIVVKTTKEDREALTTLDPDVYSVPPRYSTLNYILVQLNRISAEECRNVLEQGWRHVAPKRLVAAYDADAKHA